MRCDIAHRRSAIGTASCGKSTLKLYILTRCDIAIGRRRIPIHFDKTLKSYPDAISAIGIRLDLSIVIQHSIPDAMRYRSSVIGIASNLKVIFNYGEKKAQISKKTVKCRDKVMHAYLILCPFK